MKKNDDGKNDKKDEPKEEKKESSMYNHEGDLRQCNEGRYKFDLIEYEDPDWSEFILHVPKYMSSDQLDVNVFPTLVSVRIKGKLTQVKLWEEIIVSESKIQRALTTGKLHITMKKFKSTDALYRLYQKEK
jgi:protein TilB